MLSPRNAEAGTRADPEAVRTQRYDVTEHAVDETAEDGPAIVDLETAIWKAESRRPRDDVRGVRHTIRALSPTAPPGRLS